MQLISDIAKLENYNQSKPRCFVISAAAVIEVALNSHAVPVLSL